MPDILTITEAKRGCGFRQPGGLYLVQFGGPFMTCGKMPIPLDVCPTCHHGVKPARGFTWINGQELVKGIQCVRDIERGGAEDSPCPGCPCSDMNSELLDRCGLIWIGEKFYPTPQDFIREVLTMGYSRRIPAVPKDFEAGKTYVMSAHRKAIATSKLIVGTKPGEEPHKETEYQPGIIFVNKPTAVQYVVRDEDTEEELEAIEKRGIQLVRIIQQESKTDDEIYYDPDDVTGIDDDDPAEDEEVPEGDVTWRNRMDDFSRAGGHKYDPSEAEVEEHLLEQKKTESRTNGDQPSGMITLDSIADAMKEYYGD